MPSDITWLTLVDNGDGTWSTQFQNTISPADIGTYNFAIQSFVNTYANSKSAETIEFKVIVSLDTCSTINID